MRIAARLFVFTVLLTSLIALGGSRGSATQAPPSRSPFDALHFRDLGPAATGGRIHDLQIDPADPAVLYVGAATGGIWKSTNKGVTWRDIFGKQPENTFGSLAIFARDSRIIWAGTGENNNRQSSSWGVGVYRSTDAGETWTYLGLHDTRSIGRVVLDPVDANTAFVAAVGNLWTANEERGVFKTTDAARPGRRCSTSTASRAQATWSWIRAMRRSSTPPLISACAKRSVQWRRTRKRHLQDDRCRRDLAKARERQRFSALTNPYSASALAEARADLSAIEKEIQSLK